MRIDGKETVKVASGSSLLPLGGGGRLAGDLPCRAETSTNTSWRAKRRRPIAAERQALRQRAKTQRRSTSSPSRRWAGKGTAGKQNLYLHEAGVAGTEVHRDALR